MHVDACRRSASAAARARSAPQPGASDGEARPALVPPSSRSSAVAHRPAFLDACAALAEDRIEAKARQWSDGIGRGVLIAMFTKNQMRAFASPSARLFSVGRMRAIHFLEMMPNQCPDGREMKW
jgi:hypothetical protein